MRYMQRFESFKFSDDHIKSSSHYKKIFDLANKNGMSNECATLVGWWGATGYLYYSSLKPGNYITDLGKEYIKSMESAFKDGVFGDFDVTDKWSKENNKIDSNLAEERLSNEMGKSYLDDVFNDNMTTVTTPFKIWKNTNLDDDKYFKIGRDGWTSFSIHKDYYKGAFGDDYIGFELPTGTKFIDTYGSIDTYGLADKGEVIINPGDLKEEWIIQKGYSKPSDISTGNAENEFKRFVKNRNIK